MGETEELAEQLAQLRGLNVTVPNAAGIYDHFLGGEDDFEADRRAAQRVCQRASAPVVPRSHAQIIQFFDGLEVTGAGVADINYWPQPSPVSASSARRLFYSSVARKKADSADEPARS